MIEKNENVTLKIKDISSDGNGVGHAHGMAVFVPFTAVGDEVVCRVQKVAKRHCFAKVIDIVKASHHRIEVDCPSFYRCGGCALRHIDYKSELAAKQLIVKNAFERIGKVSKPVEDILSTGETLRYRNKAQYVVRKVGDKAMPGFFAARSHDFIPFEDCLLQPELFTRVAQKCCSIFDEQGIKPYDEVTHTGSVRHLLFRKGFHSGEIMLCIVSKDEIVIKGVEQLAKQFGLTSLLLNINSGRTNVILGHKTKVLFGSEKISERLFDLNFDIYDRTFFQVNTVAAELLYDVARRHLPRADVLNILDLYCGVGSIGLSLSRMSDRLVGVDIVKESVDSAQKNAVRAGYKNARFLSADAADGFAVEDFAPDVVIVDPPRKGLDERTLKLLLNSGVQTVIMISCNPATAARDVAALCDRYAVERVTPVDMFPRTCHVECVVLLSKVQK